MVFIPFLHLLIRSWGLHPCVTSVVVEKDEYPCLLLTRFTTDSIQRKAVKAFIPNTSVIVNWLVSSF